MTTMTSVLFHHLFSSYISQYCFTISPPFSPPRTARLQEGVMIGPHFSAGFNLFSTFLATRASPS